MRNIFKQIMAWLREVPPTGRDKILPQKEDFDTREWIRVTDMLPDTIGDYMIYYNQEYYANRSYEESPRVSVARYCGKREVWLDWDSIYSGTEWDGSHNVADHITHWKPLPSPPKEEDDQ